MPRTPWSQRPRAGHQPGVRPTVNTAASSEPRIQHVRVTDDEIIAQLVDGRVISVPLAWSWRLSEATPRQRARFRLIGSGQGVHWPDVNEDISVEGMLHGVPAHRPRRRRCQSEIMVTPRASVASRGAISAASSPEPAECAANARRHLGSSYVEDGHESRSRLD